MKTLLTTALFLAVCVSISALSLTQNHFLSSKNTFHLASSQDLTLSLDVAARDQGAGYGKFSLSISYLNIYWNDVLVSKWNAPDYNVHHLQFKVTPKNGINNLTLSVLSSSDAGSCFSNVSLKGKDGKQLVVNGNFSGNFGSGGWGQYTTTNNLIGWNTLNKYGAGLGSIFNPRFPSTVAALGDTAPSVYQTFQIKVLQQGIITIKPNQNLTLSFDAAAREDLPLAWLEVYWNGVLILDWRPIDKEIHSFTFNVNPRQGLNTLEFGVSTITKGGACFKNVSLKGPSTEGNVVVNGNFDDDVVIGSQIYRKYDTANTIKGWRTLRTFALGTNYYNKRFTKNVCALDNTVPSIYQTFYIKYETN